MHTLETDLKTLNNAIRLFFMTIKNPRHWAYITGRSGLSLDRPASAILHILTESKTHSCRVQDLALQLGVEAPSVTRKTQELELAGLVKRVPDPIDKRAVELTITARGLSTAKRLHRAQQAVMHQALRDWNAADRHTFVKLFERFSQDYAAATQINLANRKDQDARTSVKH